MRKEMNEKKLSINTGEFAILAICIKCKCEMIVNRPSKEEMVKVGNSWGYTCDDCTNRDL